MPEETFPREGIIQRDEIPGGWFVALAFCELSGLRVSAGWQEEIKIQLLSESILHFSMVRSEGNLRDVDVSRVPSLMLTYLVQSADELHTGAEYFITLPLQILDVMG